MQLVKVFLKKWLTLNLDQFSEELKTNCIWLKLLIFELSVLHGLFDKRKHFFNARVENKVNKHPWFGAVRDVLIQ